MSYTLHDVLMVFLIAAITIGLRALPFLIFPEGRSIPKLVTRLSNALPCAVMGMLVVYCLRNVNLLRSPFGLPELLAVGITVVCHIWKRNTLLSILTGTVSYILLIQVAF